jgi:hypothetical protein
MKQDSHVVLQIADCMTTYYMSTKSGRKSQKEPKRAKDRNRGSRGKPTCRAMEWAVSKPEDRAL